MCVFERKELSLSFETCYSICLQSQQSSFTFGHASERAREREMWGESRVGRVSELERNGTAVPESSAAALK